MCYSILKHCNPEESGAENIYRCLQFSERNNELPKWKDKSDRMQWEHTTGNIRRMAKERGW